MTRRLMNLGLALVALSAIAAAGASPALAQGKFTWAKGTQALTVEQDGALNSATGLQKITTNAGTATCEGMKGKAAVSGVESTELTVTEVTYPGCTQLEAATVAFNECDYKFTPGQTIGQTAMETTGKADIECPAGKQITIDERFCEIRIPAQNQLGGHLIYKTITNAPYQITIEATLTGLIYQGIGFCTSGNNGTYQGNLTVKGYKAEPHEAAQQTVIEVH